MSHDRKSRRQHDSRFRLAVAVAAAIATAAVLSYFRHAVAGFVRTVASAFAVLSYIAGSVPGGVYWTVAVGVSAALAIRLLTGAVRTSHGPDEPIPVPPGSPREQGTNPSARALRGARESTPTSSATTAAASSDPTAGRARLFEESIAAARHGSPLGGRIDRRVAEAVAVLYGYSRWNRETGETLAARPEIAARPVLRAAVSGSSTAAGDASNYQTRGPLRWYTHLLTPRKAAKQREARERAEKHRLEALISELETLETL